MRIHMSKTVVVLCHTATDPLHSTNNDSFGAQVRSDTNSTAEATHQPAHAVSHGTVQQVLSMGVMPTGFKSACVTPLLKKADLDLADVKSYRPISNVSVVSKLLEHLVARQLTAYISAERLLPDLQSAYRAYHSTETALLKVLSNIQHAVDSSDLAVLTLLEPSTVFDTVDCASLLHRLATLCGLGGSLINWFRSYLEGRTKYIRCCTSPTRLLCGVPQGSVLGPILFLLCMALQLIEANDLHPQIYAGDTNIRFLLPRHYYSSTGPYDCVN